MKIFESSEDQIDFDSFTRFPFLLFKLLSFDFKPLNVELSLMRRRVCQAKQIYVQISLFGIFMAFVSILTYTIVNVDDFVNASSALLESLTTVVIGTKSLITFLHRDEIWSILPEFQKIFERRLGKNKEYQVKKYLDQYYFFIKVYAMTNVFISLPVFYRGIPFFLFGEMELSIKYWFPFDVFTLETYPYYLAWSYWIAWIFLGFGLAADTLLYAFMTTIAMEFDILKIDLTNLGSTTKQELDKNIQDLTDHHNKLIELSEKLQNIYSVTLFGSFAVSAVLICIILFQLLLVNDEYAFYIPFLGLIGGQILFLCNFGQKLIDSSESISEGAYNSNWETFTENGSKKGLILIMLRAQKAQRLTAMKYADISLATFSAVSYLS